MPKYQYEAKISPQQKVRGSLTADSRKAAIDAVCRLGYAVLSIEEEGAPPPEASSVLPAGPRPGRTRIPLREVAGFTRQLAELFEAGVPLIRSLDLLQQQMNHAAFRATVQSLRDACIAGQALSAAFAAHPEAFSHLYAVMVRASEATGTVESTLKKLADYLERMLSIRTRVLSALAYPAFMLFVGCGTIGVLLAFVVPKLAGIFDDMGRALPLPTQILLGASRLATGRSPWLFPVLAIGLGIGLAVYRTRAGENLLVFLRERAPVFGPLLKKIETARFAQTLAVLLENGVPILEALRVTTEVVQDRRLATELVMVEEKVRGGSRLSAALTGSRFLSPFLIEKMAVGEEAGRLEKTLQKIAEAQERESEEAMKVMLSLLEPALILLLGLVVALIVVAILLPIFEMSLLPTG